MSHIQVHTVIDTAKAAQLRREAAMLKAAEETVNWIKEQTALSNVYTDNPNPFVVDPAYGTWMTAAEFERRLLKLDKNFRYIWGGESHRTQTKLLALEKPDGTLRKLWPYEIPIMPERTIWNDVVRHVPPPPSYVMNPKDAPPCNWVPLSDDLAHLWKPNGRGVGKWEPKDPNALLPGWTKVSLGWGEKIRGWRTMLLKLYGEKILTREQIEREFFAANTAAWQQGMDKASKKTLAWV